MVSDKLPIIWLLDEDSPWIHLVAELDALRLPLRAGRRTCAVWDGLAPLRELGTAALILVGPGPYEPGSRNPDLLLLEPSAELLLAAAFALSFGFALAPGATGLPAAGREPSELSGREQQVLDLVANGRANKEIAADLDLNLGTVKFHIANLFAKFGAHSRAELISRAAREGYLGV